MSSNSQESMDLLENTLQWSHILPNVVGFNGGHLRLQLHIVQIILENASLQL